MGYENAEWNVLHEWATLYCVYAMDMLKQKNGKDSMNEFKDKITDLEHEMKL